MASRGSAVAFGVMRQRWGGRSRVSELVLIERKRGADGTPEASPWGTRRVIAGMLTGAVVLGFAAWPRMAPAATPASFADLAHQLLPPAPTPPPPPPSNQPPQPAPPPRPH